MKKLNNKGFTLIEIIAVVVIIGILGLIAIPNVLNTINKSKNANYDILVKDITIASIQLFEEIEYVGTELYHYDLDGRTNDIIDINISLENNKVIETNIQTIVSNGFLTGINNPDKEGSNKNYKIITNPKTKEDIGECSITITKIVDKDNNYNTSYKIEDKTLSDKCPTTQDYNKALNIQEGE